MSICTNTEIEERKMSFENDTKKAIKIATDPNGKRKFSFEEIFKRNEMLKAAQELKQYCNETNCTTCIFSRPDGDCSLSPESPVIPQNWQL